MRSHLRTAVAGVAAIGLGLATGGGAAANDSSAELAAGGLVLTKNASIQMKSEDLYISDKQVRVHYVFANTSPKDVTILVAFPMPDVTTEGVDDDITIPTDSPTNLLGFSTTVNGVPVHADVQQKVVDKNGVDQTAFLQSLHIPLAPHLQSTNAFLDKLPKATQDKLKAMGLAIEDDFDAGKGMEHHVDATWTLKTTFFWQQTFRAGQSLDVVHQYQPAVGGSSQTMWGLPEYQHDDPDYESYVKKYCVDADFIAAAAKMQQDAAAAEKATQQDKYDSEERVDYILTTGANWGAPIGDFKMTIDKGSPANLVSFCGTGVAKISPTQFQVHYTNFTPTQEVAVLILVAQQPAK